MLWLHLDSFSREDIQRVAWLTECEAPAGLMTVTAGIFGLGCGPSDSAHPRLKKSLPPM